MRATQSRWIKPLRWMRDEQFWRDVFKSVVSGVLVLGVAYAFGLSAGTIPPPTNSNILLDVLVVAGAGVVSALLAGVFVASVGVRHLRPRDHIGRVLWDMHTSRLRKAGSRVISAVPWVILFGGTAGLSWLVLHWLSP